MRRVFGRHADHARRVVDQVDDRPSARRERRGRRRDRGAWRCPCGVLPPTINLTDQDPECDLDFIPNDARAPSRSSAALCNCLGFGSKNSALVVGARLARLGAEPICMLDVDHRGRRTGRIGRRARARARRRARAHRRSRDVSARQAVRRHAQSRRRGAAAVDRPCAAARSRSRAGARRHAADRPDRTRAKARYGDGHRRPRDRAARARRWLLEQAIAAGARFEAGGSSRGAARRRSHAVHASCAASCWRAAGSLAGDRCACRRR